MFPHSLVEGYQHFMKNRFSVEFQHYEMLADKGQKPSILLIGCADSRVSPSIIFNAGPGDIFVVRNVANLIPPYSETNRLYHGTSAALEYGVNILKVKHIVVLGHAACGGVHTFASRETLNQETGSFISTWLQLLEPAHKKIKDGDILQKQNFNDYVRQLEFESIKNSIRNLKSFPFIQKRIAEEKLNVHGAFFSIATGELSVFTSETNQFQLIERSTSTSFPTYFGCAEAISPEEKS